MRERGEKTIGVIKNFANKVFGEKSATTTQKDVELKISLYLTGLYISMFSADPLEEEGTSAVEHRVVILADGNNKFRIDQYKTSRDEYYLVMSDFENHNEAERVMFFFMINEDNPNRPNHKIDDAFKINKGREIQLTPEEQLEFVQTIYKAKFDPDSNDTDNLKEKILAESSAKKSTSQTTLPKSS